MDNAKLRQGVGIVLRPLKPDQSSQLLRLQRTVFPAEEVAYTIYDATGVDRYLAALMTWPGRCKGHLFWGAWMDGELVGYAHFRALPESWHLNHIAVLPAYQGMGIGHRFWTLFSTNGRTRGHSRLTLDVEQNNERAIRWYRKRGMKTTGITWRYEKVLSRDAPAKAMNAVRILDWENAQAWQLAYGFSRFRLEYEGATWTVGRPNAHTYTVRQPIPDVVEAVLAALDPSRRLLFMVERPIQSKALALRGATLRMRGCLD